MNSEIREFVDETRKRLDELEKKLESEGNIYPCVKVANNGVVVLFTKENSGICIGNPEFGGGCDINDYWDEAVFTPLSGTITYKNGQPVRTEREES
jgi:hypothetical protein